MCGIVGLVGSNFNTDSLFSIVSTLDHRGPDAKGQWYSETCWLGHTRLAVIDINQRANQPFKDIKGKEVIVYNGEIYNFKEIRKELQIYGIKFKTQSDTEIILHSWRKWGSECFIKFKGMFALAIWDPIKMELILARDRFGEKPLYYASCKNSFFFSSELRTILKLSGINQLDLSSINEYLYFGHVATPNSFAKGVLKILPGTFIRYTKASTSVHKYWAAPDQRIFAHKKIISSKIRSKFLRSLEVNLVSDVEVGLLLSGGIDSTAIATLVRKEFGQRINCISVGYKGSKNDETNIAKSTCKKLGHSFFRVEISNQRLIENFPNLISSMDEPIADLASSSYFEAYIKAKQLGLKVVLGGLGSDELFWGYDFHNKNVNNSELLEIGRKKNYLTSLNSAESWRDQLLWRNDSYPASDLPEFFRKERYFFDNNRLPSKILTKKNQENWSQGIQRILLRNWLEGNCLSLTDRLAMSQSIESRSPFLYPDLSQFALSLTFSSHETNKNSKSILREALRNDLEDEILFKSKKGFTPPVGNWIHNICNSFYSTVTMNEVLGEFLDLELIMDKTLVYKLCILALWLEDLESLGINLSIKK